LNVSRLEEKHLASTVPQIARNVWMVENSFEAQLMFVFKYIEATSVEDRSNDMFSARRE